MAPAPLFYSDVRIDIKSVGICGSDVHYYQVTQTPMPSVCFPSLRRYTGVTSVFLYPISSHERICSVTCSIFCF